MGMGCGIPSAYLPYFLASGGGDPTRATVLLHSDIAIISRLQIKHGTIEAINSFGFNE